MFVLMRAPKKWLIVYGLLFWSLARADVLTHEVRLDAARLSQQSSWLKLMHYSKNLLYGFESRVDGPEYFFARDGKTNPQTEILASVEAFANSNLKIGRLSLHPQCAFPYRYRFLKKKLNLQIADIPCPDFKRWLSGVQPKSATVVYASGYANNPISVFGHLFLRINSEKKESEFEANELLDQGIGFEAVADGTFGFRFAMNATFGGYSGQFSVVPYYAKVQEYSNLESRDLWEYHLSLSKTEVLDLMTHLWELETNTYLNYFFADENCAFQLMALIEAIKPEWNLTEGFSFYVMPSQSIRVLAEQPGAVQKVTQRLSLHKRMTGQLTKLDVAQREQFNQLVKSELDVSKIQDKQVLEVASLFLSYKNHGRKDQNDSLKEVSVTEVLRHRATLGGLSTLSTLSTDPDWSRPDRAHLPFRAGVLAGVAESKSFFDIHYKVSLHDILNFQAGYARYSRFDFLNIKARIETENRKIFLKEIDFLKMETYLPISTFETEPSWRVGFSLATPEDLNCYPCREFVVEGALGAALEPWNKQILLYIMAPLRAGFADHLGSGYRLGPAIEVGAFFEAAEIYRTQISAKLQSDLFQDIRPNSVAIFEVNQSYFISPRWDARWLTKFVVPSESFGRRHSETGLQLNYYF